MRASTEGSGTTDLSAAAKAALRVLCRALLENVDGLADRLTLMVLQREPAYAPLGGSASDEFRDNLRANLERGLQSLGGTLPAGADPRDTSRATGRIRARQGVPLEAVLRAYRLGGRVIWEGLLATSRERFDGRYDHALLDAAGYVWRVIDASSAALVDEFRLEEARLRSRELSRRHAFVNALLEGRGRDPELAEDAAAVLGLPASGRMLCVVAPLESPRDDPLRSPRDVLGATGIISSWQVRPSDVVGLVALGEAPARSVVDALGPVAHGRVGVSPVVMSFAEVGDAYMFARTAAHTLTGPGVAFLDDRLPEALLVSSPHLATRLRDVAFGELLNLSRTERDTMLATLDAVIDSDGSPTHAAQRLYCHRNTVIYRLQRIQSVTGRRITDPRDRLLIALALLARSLA